MNLNGMVFGYGHLQRKSVTTMPDECKAVGAEISTAPKCETTAFEGEELVSPSIKTSNEFEEIV